MPDEEQPLIEQSTEPEPQPFAPVKEVEILETAKLFVMKVYDRVTRGLLGLLTDAQKTDLTDGGATVLHKHDHGAMDGLADDDHAQYHNDARGDARYYTEGEIDTQMAAKANDDAVVKLTGDQTVAGIKTLSSFPITPSSAPTTDYQVANKKYVDDSGILAFTAFYAIAANKPVCILASNGQAVQCCSVIAGLTYFVGFSTVAAAATETVKVQLMGKYSSLSGLTIASTYYLNDSRTTTTISQTTANTWGGNDTRTYYQTFKATKLLISGFTVYLKETSGNPGSFTGYLYSGKGNCAGSTLLVTKAGSCNATYSGEVTLTFDSPIIVTAGNVYSIAVLTNAFIGIYYQNSDVYSDGWLYTESQTPGACTTDPGIGDLYFKIQEQVPNGVIDTSAGTVSKSVGMAVSATELVIKNL